MPEWAPPPRLGSMIDAIEWTETLAGEATLDALHGQGGACGWHRQGACGLHRQNEIHAGVESIVSKNLADNGIAAPRDTRAAPLGDVQMAASERVRVAPPGSDTWTSADSPV